MKTLVTGASGHIGSAIVRQLASSGRKVRAMVRPTSRLDGLQDVDGKILPNVEIINGDLLDPPSLARALEGVEVLYHTAAVFKTRLLDESVIEKTNVEGTSNILHACSRSRELRKILFTSSVAAIGCSRRPDIVLNETTWNNEPIDKYVASKTQSEKNARELMEKLSLPIVFLNPATVLGAHDFSPTPSNGFVLLSMQKPSPVYFAGGHSYCHVEDVAKAHIVAETKGRVGERYVLAGDNISMEDFFQEVSKLTGNRKPLVKIGHIFVTIAGFVFESLSWITGNPPLFTRKKAHKLIDYYGYFDSSKAKTELDYHTQSFPSLLKDCERWFQKRGWLAKG